jgi:ABC-type multidrug transport system fused ATPase/permease subunit
VLVSLVLMYRPLHGLAQAVFGWWSGLASLDRLDELLRNPAEPWQPVWRRAEPIVSLRLNDLSFGYDDQPVLRRANASLQGGSLVVITGASGSGKSTLLGLLSGVLPASPNGIWIDGVPASRDSLTAATAWMPQSPSLFHDTILRNVALGSDRPDRARVIEVCQRVGAHSFIAARHRGYDGMLREGGSDLSVGQRQRITLARALYRDAPLLLLDEPTSALDDELECRVVAVCRERAERGDLVIVATHREDFLRHADCVLELQEGVMSEWERRVVDARLH